MNDHRPIAASRGSGQQMDLATALAADRGKLRGPNGHSSHGRKFCGRAGQWSTGEV
jgi:hypothetical protein